MYRRIAPNVRHAEHIANVAFVHIDNGSMDNMDNGSLLPTRLAAAELGCSTQTIRKLIAERQLAAVRVGRVLKVTSDSLQAYLDANTVGASLDPLTTQAGDVL